MWNPFKDKQVVIVGNAHSLLLTRTRYHSADFIDSNEIIIRINKGVFSNRPKKMGKLMHYALFDNIYHWDFINITCPIIISSQEESRTFKWRYSWRNRKRVKHSSYMDLSNFTFLPSWNDKEAKEKLNVEVPSTGALMLNYLSNCACKEVNIIGFDWKKTASYNEGFNKREGAHDFASEERYFKQLIESKNNWNYYDSNYDLSK